MRRSASVASRSSRIASTRPSVPTDQAAVAVASRGLEAQHRDLRAALAASRPAGAAWPARPAACRRTARSRRPCGARARAVRPAPHWRCRPASPARTPRCPVPPSPPRRAPPPCPAPPPGRACPPPPRARWRARAPASSGRRWRAAPWGLPSACARPCRRRERRSAGGARSCSGRSPWCCSYAHGIGGCLATCVPVILGLSFWAVARRDCRSAPYKPSRLRPIRNNR